MSDTPISRKPAHTTEEMEADLRRLRKFDYPMYGIGLDPGPPLTDEDRRAFAQQTNHAAQLSHLSATREEYEKQEERAKLWELYVALCGRSGDPETTMKLAQKFLARWKAETEAKQEQEP